MQNRAALEAWYWQECVTAPDRTTDVRESIRKFKLALYIFPMLQIPLVALTTFASSGLLAAIVDTAEASLRLLLTAALIHIVSEFWRWRFRSLRWLGRVVPLEDAEVRESVEEIAFHSASEGRPIRLWLHRKNPSIGPSVFEDAQEIHIVFPAGFLLLPLEEGDALVAHEWGHVCQQDSPLWLPIDGWMRGVMWTVLPFALLDFLVWPLLICLSIVKAEDVVSAAVAIIVYCVVRGPLFGYQGWRFWQTVRAVRSARQWSEELADVAAILFASGKALQTVVGRFGEPRFWDVHASKRSRVKAIEDYMQRYQI